MTHTLNQFATAFKAEHIKKKGIVFYWTNAILATLPVILYGLIVYFGNTDFSPKNASNYYADFIEIAVSLFAGFFFPLIIIIAVSRITQLDHKNGGWQLMETQPISKFSIYFSKLTVALIGNFVAIVSFIVFSFFVAWVLTFFKPMPPSATAAFEWMPLLHLVVRLFVASLFVTLLQYVISVLVSSFIWSIVIGFVGLMLTAILYPMKALPVWYPYFILANVSSTQEGGDLGNVLLYTEYLGILASLFLAYFGYHWYKNKSLKVAFLHDAKKIASIAGITVVLGGLFAYTLQPHQAKTHHRTVLAGKIESKKPFRKLLLVHPIMEDTLAVIPIKNNEFHYVFPTKLVSDKYRLVWDEKFLSELFMGDKDSSFVKVKFEKQFKAKVKGTRFVENQGAEELSFESGVLNYYMQQEEYLNSPSLFSTELYKTWQSDLTGANKFRSVDNYMMKPDFLARKQKLLSVHYLNIWQKYQEKREIRLSKAKTDETWQIAEIRKRVSLQDESLLSDESYTEFLKGEMTTNDTTNVDKSAKFLNAVAKLPASSFKDKLLYLQLRNSLDMASNGEERNTLLAQHLGNVSNTTFRKQLETKRKLLESLDKGQPAPMFEAQNLSGEPVSLADLRGKFVVIDAWATWCAPCKEQDPFFERLATKYKNNNIQFLSLSIDDIKPDWIAEAKKKPTMLLQWLAKDNDALGMSYNFSAIPQFILIDPEGKLVYAKMPMPEQDAFEILLRKAMNLPDEN